MNNIDKFAKSLLLNNLDSLFTPGFLSLLKSYEIEKYLGSNRVNIFRQKEKNKTFKSFVEFCYRQTNEGITLKSQKVAFYTMIWRRGDYSGNYMSKDTLDFFAVKQIFIERDFERLDHLIYKLMFAKNSAGIRLHSIELSYILDISD